MQTRTAGRFLLTSVILLSAPVSARAQDIVYVSATGGDRNNCADEQTPCRALAGALAQVAAGGDIVVLSSGSYGGATITQAVTIEAPVSVLALVAPSTGNGVTINAGASDAIVLRGLTVKGSGTGIGILFSSGAFLSIESCVIEDWRLEVSAFSHPPRMLRRPS